MDPLSGWIGFLFLLVNIYQGSAAVPSQENKIPTLKIHKGEGWESLTTETGSIALYSIKGDDLFLTCHASYPIQWNISGIIAPAEIIKILPPTRDLESEIFTIKLNAFFLDAGKFPGLAASAEIACESVMNRQSRDHISVFVRGKSPLIQYEPTTVTDSTIIPCASSDPNTPTKLYRVNEDGSETHVQDVTYHTTQGFHSNNDVFEGVYRCKKGTYSIEITAITTSTRNSEYEYHPASKIVKVFADEAIELRCSSKSNPVKLDLDISGKTEVDYVVNEERVKTVKLSGVKGLRGSVAGKVACVSEKQIVKEWTYEFVDIPQLYLDNFEGEVDCLSPETPKMAQTVRCINSMHCQYMTHCLKDVSLCNFKKQKQFYAKTDTYCWVEKLHRGMACASVPYSHLNGIAQCTVSGLTRRWEFFVSLDLQRYSDWRDAPKRELVRLDETPNVLYADGASQFVCTASAYLFADSITFEIEYKNGTRDRLKHNGKNVNVTNPSSESPRKIDEFNMVGELDIILPSNTAAIHCIAPWWNSSDVMVASSHFETKQLRKPYIKNGEDKLKETFYVGEKNRRLTCHAGAEPQPSYKWLFEKENTKKIFPELINGQDLDGAGYLEFPDIDTKYSGEFQCLASNKIGQARLKFAVEVPAQCRYNLDCDSGRKG